MFSKIQIYIPTIIQVLWITLFAYISLIPFYYLQPVGYELSAQTITIAKYLPVPIILTIGIAFNAEQYELTTACLEDGGNARSKIYAADEFTDLSGLMADIYHHHCGADEFVSGFECPPCAAGTTNAAGDIWPGPDTVCDNRPDLFNDSFETLD